MQMENKTSHKKYADIINLPHHVSSTRPQMAIMDRAAQFSPFAALTGYDAVIEETGRLTEEFMELDENRKAVLNQKLQILLEYSKEQPKVTVTYFVPDHKKQGGRYVEFIGSVKKIDISEGCVIMNEDTKIPIEYIYEIVM